MSPQVPVERWSTRTTFVFALCLAALGLGNLWRFSYLMGENGGAPFFLSYLFCLFFMAVPLQVAEVLLGSHGRGSPLLTLNWAADAARRSRLWTCTALLACVAAFILLVCHVVVSGWTLSYLFHQQLGSFAAISLEDAGLFLGERLADPLAPLAWQFLALAIAGAVLVAGVRRGIGLLAWIALPLVMTLFGVLIDYAIDYGNLDAAGAYLFRWQMLDFDAGSFILAMRHAFYTLCIGLAVGMSYGAYAPQGLPVARSVMAVAIFDAVTSVAAGVVVLPVLLANNLLPAEGIELLFIAIPHAYGNLPFGDLYGALFFLLVFTTLLGTAVALLQPGIAILEQSLGVRRWHAVMFLGLLAWILSALVALDLRLGDASLGLLDKLERVVAQLLMPIAAVALAIFVGWRMPRALLRRELAREPDILRAVWYFLIRFLVVPTVLLTWWWLLLVP